MAALLADIQLALQVAGFTHAAVDLISVGKTEDGRIRLSVVETNPEDLGFSSSQVDSLLEDNMLTASVAVTDFASLGQIKFLLSVDGALPRLVTVNAGAGNLAELIININNALSAAGINNVSAQADQVEEKSLDW